MAFVSILVLNPIVGDARADSQGVSSGFLLQGVIVFGSYGALLGAVIGGIAAGVHRVMPRKKSPRTPP
ncbi:MAG: hypothetical protein ACREDE_04690 [Thermoplasmata archaeon]